MQIVELVFHFLTLAILIVVYFDIARLSAKNQAPEVIKKPKKPQKKSAYPNLRKHTPKVITDEMAWKLEKEEKDGLGW